MNVIILAAGFATRLYPLTRNRPKPLLDVGGKPVITRQLDRILQVPGISEVIVVTNEKFHDQFKIWCDQYQTDVAVRLLNDHSTKEEERLGGVGDMALAMENTSPGPDGKDEDLLVAAGDNLMDFDLRPFAKEFQRIRRPLLLARRIEGKVPPCRHGEICVDPDGTVTSFREKPADPRSNLAAACLYFFPPEVRSLVFEYLKTTDDNDAPGHFIAWLVKQTPVSAIFFSGRLFDIGNSETLSQARAAYE